MAPSGANRFVSKRGAVILGACHTEDGYDYMKRELMRIFGEKGKNTETRTVKKRGIENNVVSTGKERKTWQCR